ncbi:MAG: hypothetical protein MPN21_17505 [Thermoanaerobaculia bacterium]|nr:hypothetical protein [Thermoanaerobaculia bacterium]
MRRVLVTTLCFLLAMMVPPPSNAGENQPSPDPDPPTATTSGGLTGLAKNLANTDSTGLVDDLGSGKALVSGAGGRELIIRAAYANLEDYSRLAEPSFSLVVDDFYHLEPEDFATTFWSDIVSPSEGLLIDMHRETKHNTGLGVSRSEYQPSFRYVGGQQSGKSARLTTMTIAEVLGEVVAADSESNLAEVAAMTSFQVRATIGENSRVYRASFAWVPAMAKMTEQTALVVLDQVTQGVEEAAVDRYAPLRDRSFLRRKPN